MSAFEERPWAQDSYGREGMNPVPVPPEGREGLTPTLSSEVREAPAPAASESPIAAMGEAVKQAARKVAAVAKTAMKKVGGGAKKKSAKKPAKKPARKAAAKKAPARKTAKKAARKAPKKAARKAPRKAMKKAAKKSPKKAARKGAPKKRPAARKKK